MRVGLRKNINISFLNFGMLDLLECHVFVGGFEWTLFRSKATLLPDSVAKL